MSEAAMEVVSVELEGAAAVVAINRPDALNAMNAAVLRALTTQLSELETKPDVRAIVLTGTGDRAFSAGADIKQMSQMVAAGGRSWAMLGQALMSLIEALEKPVIAAINGVAAGGGCELALACDLRYIAASARIGQPEVNLGVIPAWGGTHRLTRLVGPGAAKDLILTGRLLTADEALRLGLVHSVVTDGEVRRHAVEIAEQLARKGPIALARGKQAINLAASLDPGAADSLEAEVMAELFGTADRMEGMAAFLEKRPARFTGR